MDIRDRSVDNDYSKNSADKISEEESIKNCFYQQNELTDNCFYPKYSTCGDGCAVAKEKC